MPISSILARYTVRFCGCLHRRDANAEQARAISVMTLGVARGRATEIDEPTGFILREDDRLGVPVPNCRAIYRLVKGLELGLGARGRAPGCKITVIQ